MCATQIGAKRLAVDDEHIWDTRLEVEAWLEGMGCIYVYPRLPFGPERRVT